MAFPAHPANDVDDFLVTSGFIGRTEFDDDVMQLARPNTADVTGSTGNVRTVSVASIGDEIRREINLRVD